VRDQDLVLDAIENAQRILAEHIEPGCHRNPETTINMLLFLLDRREVVGRGQTAPRWVWAARRKMILRKKTARLRPCGPGKENHHDNTFFDEKLRCAREQ
jgi:hypothetical protein